MLRKVLFVITLDDVLDVKCGEAPNMITLCTAPFVLTVYRCSWGFGEDGTFESLPQASY